jgi:uncharacterized protein (TIGR02598 family)
MKSSQKIKIRPSFGFSLVETVIAIGIMGLAVTALLGLLPHGMEMAKKAGDEGARARILDSIRSDISHMTYSDVPHA